MSTQAVYTRAFNRFLRNEGVVLGFIYLYNFLEGEVKFLTENLPDERREYLRTLLEQTDFERAKYKYNYLQAEMVLSRTVDNFNSYIIDVLRGYFRAHPANITEKVRKMPIRKVSGIGIDENKDTEYFALIQAELIQEKGFDEYMDYLVNDLKVNIDSSSEDFKQTSHATIRRNIIAHNRGRMNRRFLKKLGQENLHVDIPMITNFNEANNLAIAVRRFAEIIDNELVNKYGVEIFSNFAPYPTLTEGVVFPYE